MSTARPRSRALAAAAAGSLLAASITAALAWPSPAHSEDAPNPEAVTLAQAILADPTASISAATLEQPTSGGTTMVSSGAIAGFPTAGSLTYAVLSTGLASGLTTDDPTAEKRGDTDFGALGTEIDKTTLTFKVEAPDTCSATFDYRFLSDEVKDYQGFQFTDAFTYSIDDSPTTTVSVNDAAVTTDHNPAGTTTTGATSVTTTPPITFAKAPNHKVTFSIYDAGDAYLDSDVLLDNLTFGDCATTPPSSPPSSPSDPGTTTPPATTPPASPSSPAPRPKTFAAATPRITGTAIVGHTLTVQRGTWTPTPSRLGYQWLRNGRAITGATHTTYRLPAADRGARISVKVSGAKVGYTTKSVASSPTAPVKPATFKAGKPTITGKREVGKRLTAAPGRWSPTATYHYQWLRNGHVIKGATHKTYTVHKKDRGKHLSVRVTASRSGYVTAHTTSAAVTIKRH